MEGSAKFDNLKDYPKFENGELPFAATVTYTNMLRSLHCTSVMLD